MCGDEVSSDITEIQLSVYVRVAAKEIGIEIIEFFGESLAQLVHARSLKREAACERVSAKVFEDIGNRLELRVQIDGRNAARGTDRSLIFNRDHQRRAMIFLRDAASC